jgi:hypothetical protein
MSNSEVYREAIEEQIANERYRKEKEAQLAKQPMPPPHTKDKVWTEIIKDTEEEKVIMVHDNIEGKRCQACDKELQPDKIVWYTHKSMMTAINPKTNEIDKPEIYIAEYGMCSENCKKILVRTLEKDTVKAAKEIGKKGTVISYFEK